MTDKLLEAALKYAAAGRPVFFNPNGKVPAKGSTGFYQATTDPDQLRRMRAEHPEYQYLAAATGYPSECILDLDPRKGKTLNDVIDTVILAFGPLVLDTRTWKTPSDGRHLGYQPSGRVKSRNGILQGVDWKADGAFVMVPPSPGYELVEDKPLLPVPLAITTKSHERKKVKGQTDQTDADGKAYQQRDVHHGQGLHDSAISALGKLHTTNLATTADQLYDYGVVWVNHNVAAGEWTERDDQDFRRACNDALETWQAGWPFIRTEVGQAAFFAHYFGSRARFDWTTKRWFYWYKDLRWALDRGGKLRAMVVESLEQRMLLAKSLPQQRREAEGLFIRKCETAGKIDSIRSLAQLPLGKRQEQWNIYRHQLGIANGVLDVRSRQMIKPDPEQMITMSTAYNYNPDAKAPRWERFVTEVFPDPDIRDYVSKALGYSITGEQKEQVFFLLVGKGANGKSTLTKHIVRVLGDYAISPSSSTFTRQRGGSGISNDLHDLIYKRFAICSEAGKYDELNMEKIKAVTGGDNIRARPLYGHNEEFLPTCKLWFYVNTPPRIDDPTDSTWRRVSPIPLTQRFNPNDDPTLDQVLEDESEGILAWLVRQAMRYYAEGLKMPEAMERLKKEWQHDEDVIGQFLDQTTEVGDDKVLRGEQTYRGYQLWSDRMQIAKGHRLGPVNFGKEMKNRLNSGHDKKGNFYRGRGWKPDWKTTVTDPFGVGFPIFEDDVPVGANGQGEGA